MIERDLFLNCGCGHEIMLDSRQPGGSVEPLICERCWQVHLAERVTNLEKRFERNDTEN